MRSFSGLYLDKRNETFPLHDEVDVPVPAPESALDDAPTLTPKPPFGDPLPELSQLLLDRCHGAEAMARSASAITERRRVGSFYCRRVRT